MGIRPISITVISGQKNAAEIVIAASLFIEINHVVPLPISTNKDIRDDFFLSLENFRIRESFMHFKSEYYAKNIKTPNDYEIPFGDLCLALDKQGYAVALSIFSKFGLNPEEKVHQSIGKLNLIEQNIPPYPEIQTTSEYWKEIRSELNRIGWERRRVKSQKGRRALFEKHVPMDPIEKEFYYWYKFLYDSLLPWKETCGKIMSAWS
jgi:hypothetical protein